MAGMGAAVFRWVAGSFGTPIVLHARKFNQPPRQPELQPASAYPDTPWLPEVDVL